MEFICDLACLREAPPPEALRRAGASAKAVAWKPVLTKDSSPRIHFFEKIAPWYDLLVDLFTLGGYQQFLKRAVRILNPRGGERILDLCSGTGRVVSWIAEAVGKDGEAIGMDISKKMVEVASRRHGSSKERLFLQKDVTHPWDYEEYFDGIFTSFAIHELPEKERLIALEHSFGALKEEGRMVITDFNPQVSEIGRKLSLLFFKLFERENLNFFSFNQNEILRKVGFKRVRTCPALWGILQITLAQKN